jgi:uncharacterized protein
MIDFNEPVLSDKSRADEILHITDYRANDFCFGNLFIWRKKGNTKIAFHKGFLLVRFESENREYYLYPAGKGDKAEVIRELAGEASERGKAFVIACVTPAMKAELETNFPGRFNIIGNRNNYDYIYRSQDLSELSGKKYHSKRNHITRFKSSGDWSYEDITLSNLDECLEMNTQWCKENGCGQDKGLRDEYCAVREALKNYEKLGLMGGLLRLYGKVVAFTAGERLCCDTAVVHIEKAFSRVEGAYPTINNEFVLHNCVGYEYVNREEDTGDEGLRKAKLSYQPAILLEKDIAELKEGEIL